jgi:tetratricopeptide (TPR) repeat protein
MLFDLRSRGRRRTVQTVYVGLAVLMIIGLVGVGVGAGNGFGGILNAFTGNGSNSGQKQVVSQAEKQALAATKANPNNAQAWAQLLQAKWTAAGQGSNYNTATATFTPAGKRELAGAADAWQHYTALTKSVDPSMAVLAARAYVGMGDYSRAASAWEQETVADPSAAKGYECLAVNAYAAGQTRKGNLAAAKAVSMLPKTQQLTTKQTLNQAKTSGSTAKQFAQADC